MNCLRRPGPQATRVFGYKSDLWMVAGNNMTPDVWKLTRDE